MENKAMKTKLTHMLRGKKKRKEEEERKRGNKENFTELQKPNVEAEVYDNNKKCD